MPLAYLCFLHSSCSNPIASCGLQGFTMCFTMLDNFYCFFLYSYITTFDGTCFLALGIYQHQYVLNYQYLLSANCQHYVYNFSKYAYLFTDASIWYSSEQFFCAFVNSMIFKYSEFSPGKCSALDYKWWDGNLKNQMQKNYVYIFNPAIISDNWEMLMTTLNGNFWSNLEFMVFYVYKKKGKAEY